MTTLSQIVLAFCDQEKDGIQNMMFVFQCDRTAYRRQDQT